MRREVDQQSRRVGQARRSNTFVRTPSLHNSCRTPFFQMLSRTTHTCVHQISLSNAIRNAKNIPQLFRPDDQEMWLQRICMLTGAFYFGRILTCGNSTQSGTTLSSASWPSFLPPRSCARPASTRRYDSRLMVYHLQSLHTAMVSKAS